MKSRAFPPSLALLFLLVACDGKGTGPEENQVASVTVSPSSSIIEIGNTVQLSAQVRNAKGALLSIPVTWGTSDASVATCSGSGLATAVSEGTATITAIADGEPGTASVLVVDLTMPAPPSDLTSTPLSNSEIEVAWTDNSGNEDEFRVDREEIAGAVAGTDGAPSRVFAEVGTVGPNVTTFRDGGLASGTSYRYRVRACNENGCSDPSANQTEVTTFEELVLQASDLPDGSVGEAYEQTLTATGGDGSMAWSVSEGALPDGLTLSGSGVLIGTPTTQGTFDFTIQVVGAGQSVSREFSLTIQNLLSITTSSLPNGVVGTPYQISLQASGGDGTYVWALSVGTLPNGLTLDPDGTLSGTPTTPGVFTSSITVTSAGQTIIAGFAIRVFNPLAITTAPLLDGLVGSAYSQALTATGGDGQYTWSLSVGTLPDGLTFDPGSGVISGTPSSVGTFDFTVQVTSAGLTASEDYSITILPALAVTTTSLPNGRIGVIYSHFLKAAGGDGSFTWSLTSGSLPGGLNLHPSSGVITGVPTSAGVFPFTVQVASDGLTASANLSIGVYFFLTATTTSLPPAVKNRAYSASLEATGGDGSYSWTVSAGALPSGISLGTDGTISGAPTVAGTFNFMVRVDSGDGQTSFKALSITIYFGLAVTTSSLPDGQVGVFFSQSITAIGGDGSYTWSIIAGSLPPGLSLVPSTGLISGTPTTAGTSNFTVQVVSGDAQTATAALSIEIKLSP